MTVHGQDWSSYQSATPSTSGLDFAIVKATEGQSYTNPRMVSQAQAARNSGLVLGFYHFLRSGDVKAQARFFVDAAVSVEGDMLFADWEDTAVSCGAKDAFLAEVQRLRGSVHQVGLYCNVDFWTHHDTTSNAGDALWIAQYGVSAGHPSIQARWRFHQYTSNPVDKNVGDFSNRSALKSWAAKGSSPAPKVSVSLKHVIKAAQTDPGAAQGHTTYPDDVRPVESALKAEGLLEAAYASDGSYGTKTVSAYAAWQRRCGYSGTDADGIPGQKSLSRLGSAHGFSVTS